MLNPAHILEIALLLLVAFLLGASIGSVARLAVLRLTHPKVAVPSPVVGVAPVEAAAPALVATPVIEPMSKPAAPAVPADTPAVDFTEALLALAGDKPGSAAPLRAIRMPTLAPLPGSEAAKPVAEMAPARAAGATTSGRLIAHPHVAAEPARTETASGAGADVIPFPVEKQVGEKAEEPSASVAAEPEPQVEAPVEQVHAVAEPEVVVAQDLTDVPEIPGTQAQAVVAAIPETTAEPAPTIVAPIAAEPSEPEPVAAAPISVEQPVPEPAAPDAAAEDDEAAAMRAIEGNWSPRRSTAGRARKAALPETSGDEAVAASGVAVDAATQAVSAAIISEPQEMPGKPIGLAAPRHGVKDDLTHVIGILPIIETALNRLGLYHFDQVAELTDENAGWIEVHLGIAGRIGREHWREQSRELAVAAATSKKAAGR